MALYKPSQFAEICGKSRSAVSKAKSQGRIIMSGKFIDDTISPNKELKEKWLEELDDKGHPQGPSEVEGLGKPDLFTHPAPEVAEPRYPSEHGTKEKNRKEDAEIRYREAKAKEMELKAAKLRGENIPTELVIGVFSQLGQSFQTHYKNGATNYLMDLAHRLKLSPDLEAEVKGKLFSMINEAHQNAVNDAKDSVKSIVNEITDNKSGIDSDDEDDDEND